jgi:uncharacterized membrane protein
MFATASQAACVLLYTIHSFHTECTCAHDKSTWQDCASIVQSCPNIVIIVLGAAGPCLVLKVQLLRSYSTQSILSTACKCAHDKSTWQDCANIVQSCPNIVIIVLGAAGPCLVLKVQLLRSYSTQSILSTECKCAHDKKTRQYCANIVQSCPNIVIIQKSAAGPCLVLKVQLQRFRIPSHC